MPLPKTKQLVTIPVAIPLRADDGPDHDGLAQNIERWLRGPASGFIIGSATGEEAFFSEQEKQELLRTAVAALDERRFAIGGIDCPGVTETLRRAEAFAAAGAEVVRIRIPRYPDAVEAYFQQVLSRCPTPVLLMHQCNPERFGYAGEAAADPKLLGAIAAHERVFGYVTDHDLRFESRVRRAAPPDKHFWICNGSMILWGALMGCNGTTTAIANVWPEALHELLQLAAAGRYAEAQSLQDEVQRVDAVMLQHGAFGVKAALDLLGFRGMRPRAPIAPPTADDRNKLEAVMREVGLLGD